MNPIAEAFHHSDVVFLTGAGGTGKTYLINEFIDEQDFTTVVARTATTGIAATHINGDTIHRFSGLGIRKKLEDLRLIVQHKSFKFTERKIRDTDIIIIDEISMLHQDQLTLLDKIFKFATRSEEPFGGKKILFSGDFLQLPPVDKETRESQWCFRSESWIEADPTTVELTKIYRQTDREFTELLMRLREGSLNDADLKLLASLPSHPVTSPEPIHLVSTNHEADTFNFAKLNDLSGTRYVNKAKLETPNASSEAQANYLKRSFTEDLVVPELLYIKPQCRVVMLVNNPSLGFYNGSLGTVIAVTPTRVHVMLDKSESIVEVPTHVFERRGHDGSVSVTFEQYPMKLAYAITIHKSQGMTLDACHIDMLRFFAPGQAYVALSRVRSFDGLTLANFQPKAIVTDRIAAEFYTQARAKSTEPRSPADARILDHNHC